VRPGDLVDIAGLPGNSPGTLRVLEVDHLLDSGQGFMTALTVQGASAWSELIATLRAILRDELARMRLCEVGAVTTVYARDGDDSHNNHEVNLRLLQSGVEL
jgi:hypothetical protein